MNHTARELTAFAAAAAVLGGMVFLLSTPVWAGATAALLIYGGMRMLIPLGTDVASKKRDDHVQICRTKLDRFGNLAGSLPESDIRKAALNLEETMRSCLDWEIRDETHPRPMPELPDRLDHLQRLLQKCSNVIAASHNRGAAVEVLTHTDEILRKTGNLYHDRIDRELSIVESERIADLKKEAELNEQFLLIEQELEEFG